MGIHQSKIETAEERKKAFFFFKLKKEINRNEHKKALRYSGIT